ncbi:MAG: DsbE family thiol:disulfide interchange protein, partial [Pseudohongiellaceae bacterium]
MSRFKYLLPLAVFLLLAGIMWYGLYLNPRELPSVLINKPLPDFALEAVDDNRLLTPQDLPEEMFLLNFWGSYCLPCLVEHPTL